MVVDIYDDPASRRAAWIAIRTGFFGTRVGIAPIASASVLGGVVVVAHERSRIVTSPEVDISVAITDIAHRRLRYHYRTPTPAPSAITPQGELQP